MIKRMGFFTELRRGFSDGGSLKEAVGKFEYADKGAIVRYLNQGCLLVAMIGVVQDVLSQHRVIIGPAHVVTDGQWIWPLDLAYYVEKYDVAVPDEFVQHAKLSNFETPELSTEQLCVIEKALAEQRGSTEGRGLA